MLWWNMVVASERLSARDSLRSGQHGWHRAAPAPQLAAAAAALAPSADVHEPKQHHANTRTHGATGTHLLELLHSKAQAARRLLWRHWLAGWLIVAWWGRMMGRLRGLHNWRMEQKM